jgi:hypothetical protein
LRYLEWVTDPDPSDTTYEVDFAVLLREPGQAPRVVHDHHVEGIFPEHTRLHLLEAAGFTARVVPGDPSDEDAIQPVFVCRRPG